MKKLILGCCLLGWGAILFAQQGTVASGGESSGSGGSVSYSIGQVFYDAVYNTDGKITQGLQQPYEIYGPDGIQEDGINLSTSVFPNPTVESLILKIESKDLTNFTYQLYDVLGNLIMNNKVEGIETTIKMSQLASANYFLKVLDNNSEVKIYKIIKN